MSRCAGRAFVVLLAPLIVLTAQGRLGGAPKDEQAVKALVALLDEAWSKKDAKAYASHFSPEATILLSMGIRIHGAREIEQRLAKFFRGALRDSSEKITLHMFHFVRPGIVLADGLIQIDGIKSDEMVRTWNFHLTALLKKKGGRWVVEDTRCYYVQGIPAGRTEPAHPIP